MWLWRLAPALLGLPLLASITHCTGAAAAQREPALDRQPISVVVNTWAFQDATAAAWQALSAGGSALDAVEQGCSRCEELQCDRTVGFGGSPDEAGETTLDALLMDGVSMRAGAVSDLRCVKAAVTTARLVMAHTRHTMLAGEHATQFAADMGQPVGSLSTEESQEVHRKWREAQCQPNFRRNVSPDPAQSCGPYKPIWQQQQGQQADQQLQVEQHTGRNMAAGHLTGGAVIAMPASSGSDGSIDSLTAGPRPGSKQQQGNHHMQQLKQREEQQQEQQQWPSQHAHDTIAMVVVAGGSVAAGSSSNGAIHKVPGRVGDASVPGGGAYADSEVGGCGSTGDGDVHLAFLPCYQVVESMRRGMAPTAAAEDAVRRMARRVPGYVGAVVAVGRDGRHGGAAHGWRFVYSVASSEGGGRVPTVAVEPLDTAGSEA